MDSKFYSNLAIVVHEWIDLQWLLPFQQQDDPESKIASVLYQLETVLNRRCFCSITPAYFGESRFICDEVARDNERVIFQARLIGTTRTNSSQLLAYIQEWVSTGPHITVLGVQLDPDSTCSVYLESLGDTHCLPIPVSTTPIPTPTPTPTPTPSPSKLPTEPATRSELSGDFVQSAIIPGAIGISIGVVVVLLIVIIIILVIIITRRTYTAKTR